MRKTTHYTSVDRETWEFTKAEVISALAEKYKFPAANASVDVVEEEENHPLGSWYKHFLEVEVSYSKTVRPPETLELSPTPPSGSPSVTEGRDS